MLPRGWEQPEEGALPWGWGQPKEGVLPRGWGQPEEGSYHGDGSNLRRGCYRRQGSNQKRGCYRAYRVGSGACASVSRLNEHQSHNKPSNTKVAPEIAVPAETSLLHGGGAIRYRRSGDGQLGTLWR